MNKYLLSSDYCIVTDNVKHLWFLTIFLGFSLYIVPDLTPWPLLTNVFFMRFFFIGNGNGEFKNN